MLFLCGPHAAGKTEASRVFAEDGFAVIDTGPLMRAMHVASRSNLAFGPWIAAGEAAAEGFAHRVFMTAVKGPLAEAAERGREACLVGFRAIEDICKLLDEAVDPYERAVVISVRTSCVETLRARWMAREGRYISESDFRVLLRHDLDLGLESIEPFADHVLVNDGSCGGFMNTVSNLSEKLALGPMVVSGRRRLSMATLAGPSKPAMARAV